MTENSCRHFLNVCRTHLKEGPSDLAAFRSVRKMLHWEGPQQFADFARALESLDPETHPILTRALSNGQIESKLWLIDALSGILPHHRNYRFMVVGGWIGLLPTLLLWMKPELVQKAYSLDKDFSCFGIASSLNASFVASNHFEALTADALEYDYAHSPHVIINTSCEHFRADDFKEWLDGIPGGRVVALQTNNFFKEPGHVNCFPHVFAFRKSLDLRSYLYVGELDLGKYKRFMVIGITKGSSN